MRNLQPQDLCQLQMLHFPCCVASDPHRSYNMRQNSPLFFALPDPHSPDLKATQETDSYNFETRLQPSIIIQASSNGLPGLAFKIATQNPKKQSNCTAKKIAQKETRNVGSNLMRIFLKNVIELRVYDHSIRRMMERERTEATLDDFHEWLASFGINYKNYIKIAELKRLFKGTERRNMHAVISALFKSYTSGLGISHTLTSKRIERTSTAMHLDGLRKLKRELGVI